MIIGSLSDNELYKIKLGIKNINIEFYFFEKLYSHTNIKNINKLFEKERDVTVRWSGTGEKLKIKEEMSSPYDLRSFNELNSIFKPSKPISLKTPTVDE